MCPAYGTTVHLSNSLTTSSAANPGLVLLSCFNFWLVSVMSKHCISGNMSQKGGLQLITIILQAFVHFQVLQCLSAREDTAWAVLLFMSRFSRVSTTKQSIKRENTPQQLSKHRVKGGEKCLGELMNLFSLLQLWILRTLQ